MTAQSKNLMTLTQRLEKMLPSKYLSVLGEIPPFYHDDRFDEHKIWYNKAISDVLKSLILAVERGELVVCPTIEQLVEVIANSEDIPQYWADSSRILPEEYEQFAKALLASLRGK